MYEKTIANEQRIFDIIIPVNPTVVLDLLSAEDRAIYDSLLVGAGAQYNPAEIATGGKNFKRIPVDGYILSNTSAWYASSSLTGAVEIVPMDERYTFPISFWLQKAFIYAPSPIAATIRIFFS